MLLSDVDIPLSPGAGVQLPEPDLELSLLFMPRRCSGHFWQQGEGEWGQDMRVETDWMTTRMCASGAPPLAWSMGSVAPRSPTVSIGKLGISSGFALQAGH